jgi:hypothetical protein
MTGQKIFIGKSCRVCGGRRWYVKDYHCVTCSIAKQEAKLDTPRKRAAFNRLMREYRSDPRVKAQNAAYRLGLPVVPPPPKNGRCACCRVDVGIAKLHCDHDHKTLKFRGWFCHGCNTGHGIVDNPTLLRRRAEILECAA